VIVHDPFRHRSRDNAGQREDDEGPAAPFQGGLMIRVVRTPLHRAVRLAEIAGLTLALLVLGVPGIASGAGPTCFGKRATIVGKPGVERVDGTAGADVIVGLGGRQIIFGGDGDDLICGNGGSDVIDGGAGDDRMSGGRGADFITGVDGDDLLLGGLGEDTLNFGDEEAGDDIVFGGPGDDDLHAGVGADRLFGGAGNDFLAEGEVDAPIVDLFGGGFGVDTCFAGAEDTVRSCEIRS
jgi:Ca2+-binding RTX toxin-like protein